MRYKEFQNFLINTGLNCILVFFSACFCHAQHDELLNLINGHSSVDVKEIQIDSFLLVHEEKSDPIHLADNYHEVAKWYYNNWWDSNSENDIQKAIDYTLKSLDIKKELKLLEKGSLEKTAYNLGTFYYFKGDFYSAIDAYTFLANEGQDAEMVQDSKLELGKLYKNLGDFYKALGQFSEIETFYRRPSNANANSLNLLDAYIERAETYYFIDNREFDNDIRLDVRKADSLISMADPLDVFFRKNRINQFKGNRFLQIEAYAKAISYHENVLADSVNLYPQELARALNSIAFSQIKLKKYSRAERILNKAIAKDENYSSPYENLGDLYLAQNDFEKSMFQYQKAIIYAIDKNREIIFDDLPLQQDFELASDKILLLNHIVTKANGWLDYYEFDANEDYLKNALKTFTVADQLVDIIRFESTESLSKLFWREKGSSLYMKAVEAAYLLNRPADAYYFMERNKALLLLEDISNETAKEITRLPDWVAKKEFDLKRSILLAENKLQIASDPSSEELGELRDSIQSHKRAYDKFATNLAIDFPEYAKLRRKVDVLSFKQFKGDLISENEVVLQYILNDEQGYGLMNTSENILFFKFENPASLNDKITELYARLTDKTSNRAKIAEYNKIANEVFKVLIPKEVYEIVNGKKLTVVADNVLQQIPFEALVVDQEKGIYLIEKAEIGYAYSISYLNAKREIEHAPENEFLGLAPIQFTRLSLPRLAFSGEEINAVNEIYSGETAFNAEATKARLLNNMHNFRILHLSTHADVAKGSDPWIAFSDEKLFLNEIYATKNQADMVVLSGCNTSLGELKKGEGAMSLARGFFHSGAKSVVSSLWTISDKSSKNIMADFYQGLDKGLTKAAALREAKLKYINKYRGSAISPSFWAGLIVIGDNSPLTTTVWSANHWFWLVTGTLFCIGIGVFFFRRMNS